MLAVSPSLGVVAYMVYPGRMNNNVFFLFLRLLVLPALASGTAKFIMVDNHRSHTKAYIKNYVNRKGHVYQFRPTHSPDFSPVELCFAEIKGFIKRHEHLITPSTILEWVTYAINQLNVEHIKRYTAESHYYVTGEHYKPYTGTQ